MGIADDHVNMMYDGEYEEEDYSEYRTECKSCGKSNLKWEQFEGRWKLLGKDSKVHKCSNATYKEKIVLSGDMKL